MKVLFTNDAPLIKYGMAAGFRQNADEVKVMSGSERLWGQTWEEQTKRLDLAINEFKPNFIFTEGHPGIEAKAVGEVARHHSVPHLYWAIEDPVCTDLTLASYALEADYVFTTAIECIPRYKAIGKKCEVLLFACNPEFHRNVGIQEKYRHDIVLVASNYASRYKEASWFVLPLVRAGFDIYIWGMGWDDPTRPVNLLKHLQVYGGLLAYEELPAVYSSAKIILGMNCDDTSKTQSSMRPYEALGCGGGIYLSHYTQAQQNIFQDSIIQVRSTMDTLAKVTRLLTMPREERQSRAQRGQQKVYTNHTYKQRALQISEAFHKL